MLEVIASGLTYSVDLASNGVASIHSDMRAPSTNANEAFNTGVDIIEALILAHYCEGVDVNATAYVTGIETAYEALCNNVGYFDDTDHLNDSYDVVSTQEFS